MATGRTRQGISEEPERFSGEGGPPEDHRSHGRFLVLCLTALAVVFGDIGTSPIYALRVAFLARNATRPMAFYGLLLERVMEIGTPIEF